MAVLHSCASEKSLFDLVCLRAADERWREQLPAPIEWLVADGRTYEVKADEMAFGTGNLFFETGRTNGVATGINITAADRWVHGLGRGAVICEPRRLRDGCPRLVAWDDARDVVGGDKNGTKGIAVPALSALSAPIAYGELPVRPVCLEVRFAPGTPAALAEESARSGLKGADDGMNWGRDRSYGESAESYFGQMLNQLPHADTAIRDRSDAVAIRRVNTGIGFERFLEVEYAREGKKAGVADADGHWLLDLDGVVVMVPADGLLKLCRRHFRAGAGQRPGEPTVDVVRVPLWQVPFAALSSELPAALAPLPEAPEQLAAAA